jgi:hypothetical protein
MTLRNNEPPFLTINSNEQTRLGEVYSQTNVYTSISYKPTAVLMGYDPAVRDYTHASGLVLRHVYAELQQELHRLNGYLRVSSPLYEEGGMAVYNPNECVNRAWVNYVAMEDRHYLRVHVDGVAVWFYAEEIRSVAVMLASSRHPVMHTAIFAVRALTSAWERHVDGELNSASVEEDHIRKEIASVLPLKKGEVPPDNVVDITNQYIEAYNLKKRYQESPLYASIIRIGPDYFTGYALLPYTRRLSVKLNTLDDGVLRVGGKECFSTNDLPIEAQEKIALLSMTQQNEYLDEVGMRVFDNTFILSSHG